MTPQQIRKLKQLMYGWAFSNQPLVKRDVAELLTVLLGNQFGGTDVPPRFP